MPCSEGLAPSTVYNYFVVNAHKYGLSKVRITPEDPSNNTTTTSNQLHQACSFSLTYSYSAEKEPIQLPENFAIRDKTDYDGNVALYYVPSENADVVNLPFFVTLGSKKEFYPRPYMFSKMSSLKRRQRVYSTTELLVESDIGTYKIFFLPCGFFDIK